MTGVLAGPAPACGGVRVRMHILVDQEKERKAGPLLAVSFPPLYSVQAPISVAQCGPPSETTTIFRSAALLAREYPPGRVADGPSEKEKVRRRLLLVSFEFPPLLLATCTQPFSNSTWPRLSGRG